MFVWFCGLVFFKSEVKLFVLHVPHCPQSTYKAKCLAELQFAAYLRNSILHTAKHTMIKFSLIGDPLASFLPLWIFSIYTSRQLFSFPSSQLHFLFDDWYTELAPPGFIKSLCLMKRFLPCPT